MGNDNNCTINNVIVCLYFHFHHHRLLIKNYKIFGYIDSLVVNYLTGTFFLYFFILCIIYRKMVGRGGKKMKEKTILLS